MEYDSDFVNIKNKKCYLDNIEKINAILTRISSKPMLKKESIDWEYLCFITDEEYNAAYYVIKIARSLIDDGYITYPLWKDKMLRFLSFLDKYPYFYCSESNLQTIIDGAWNSYICIGFNGETLWYKAWKKLPFYKKCIINFDIIRVSGWMTFIVQFLLAICIDPIFFSYISIAFIITYFIEYKKRYGLYFMFPISIMLFNYIINQYDLYWGSRYLIALQSIRTSMFDYSYLVLSILSLLFYVNRHNVASFERAKRNKLIRKFVI